MIARKLFITAVSATALIACYSPQRASAQDQKPAKAQPKQAKPKQPKQAKPARPNPKTAAEIEQKRKKLRHKFRVAREWRLTEALDLDEATSKKLFPILERYDGKFEKVHREAARLRADLSAELGRKAPDTAKLNRLIDGLARTQTELWRLTEARFTEVRKVLTPEQAARALFVLPELDRAIRKQIRRAMHGRRGKGKFTGKGKRGRGGKQSRRSQDYGDPF